MNLGLQGARCLVSGASRGIGRAIAECLLEEGARVGLIARTKSVLDDTAAQLIASSGTDRVRAYVADMTDPNAIVATVAEAVADFGGLDVVIANVGPAVTPDQQEHDDGWELILRANLMSAARLLTAALPHLERSRGSAVAVSSIAGLEAIGAPVPYVAAKLGLLGVVKEMARKSAGAGVRINVVAPGHVLAPGNAWDRRLRADPAQIMQWVEAEVPMRRFGAAQEIARTVVFLASPASAFTTGACVVVDGGATRATR